VVSAPVPADWWRLYRDPRLDQLVQQAMASNTDLRVAAASLLRSRPSRRSRAAGGWSGGVKMGAQRLQESGKRSCCRKRCRWPTSAISVSASYQFDLWGTLQRGIEAAKANADATQAADTARITLVADVVRAYTQVCAANEERNRPAFLTCNPRAPR
jgi:outer membrane protein TolC